jgi:hypothetical protein
MGDAAVREAAAARADALLAGQATGGGPSPSSSSSSISDSTSALPGVPELDAGRARDAARAEARAAGIALQTLVAERFRALVDSAGGIRAMAAAAQAVGAMAGDCGARASTFLESAAEEGGTSPAAPSSKIGSSGGMPQQRQVTGERKEEAALLRARSVAALIGGLVETPERVWTALDDTRCSVARLGSVKLQPPPASWAGSFNTALLRAAVQLARSAASLRQLRAEKQSMGQTPAGARSRLENLFPLVNRLNAALRVLPEKICKVAEEDFLEAAFVTRHDIAILRSAKVEFSAGDALREKNAGKRPQPDCEIREVCIAVGAALSAFMKASRELPPPAECRSLQFALSHIFFPARTRALRALLQSGIRAQRPSFGDSVFICVSAASLVQQTLALAFFLFGSPDAARGAPCLFAQLFENVERHEELSDASQSQSQSQSQRIGGQFLAQASIGRLARAWLLEDVRARICCGQGQETGGEEGKNERAEPELGALEELFQRNFDTAAGIRQAAVAMAAVCQFDICETAQGALPASVRHFFQANPLFDTLLDPMLLRVARRHVVELCNTRIRIRPDEIAELKKILLAGEGTNAATAGRAASSQLLREKLGDSCVASFQSDLVFVLDDLRVFCPQLGLEQPSSNNNSPGQASGGEDGGEDDEGFLSDPIASRHGSAVQSFVEDEVLRHVSEDFVAVFLRFLRDVAERSFLRGSSGSKRRSVGAEDRDVALFIGELAERLRTAPALVSILNPPPAIPNGTTAAAASVLFRRTGAEAQQSSSVRYAAASAALRRCFLVGSAHWAASVASDFGESAASWCTAVLARANRDPDTNLVSARGVQVPSQPSPEVLRYVFELGQSAEQLTSALSASGRSDHNSGVTLFLAGACASAAFDAIHEILQTAPASQSLPVAVVVQLQFDVGFLNQVLRLPAPHLLDSQTQRDVTEMNSAVAANASGTDIESIALSARSATLATLLESKIDPIDVAFFRPRIAQAADDCYARTKLLLGSLTSATGVGRTAAPAAPSDNTGAKSAAADQVPLKLAATAPRFQLLPVSAPLVMAHSTQKQQQDQAVELLSELASAEAGPASPVVAQQAAAKEVSRFGFARLGSMFAAAGGSDQTTQSQESAPLGNGDLLFL